MRFPWQAKKEQKSLTFVSAPDHEASVDLRVVYTKAGTRDKLHNSVVAACCGWAGRNIQKAPMVVVRDGDKGEEPVPNHPVLSLLRDEGLLSATVVSAMMHGDAFWHKVRNASGAVIAVTFVPFEFVTVVPSQADARVVSHYTVGCGDGITTVPAEDMVRFPLFGMDDSNPVLGKDVLRSVSRHILTDNKISQYASSVMDSPSPRLALTPKDAGMTPNAEEANFIAQQMSEATSGKKAGRPLVMTFPADVTPFSFSPDQMAVKEMAMLPETRICAVFGIPPTVLQLKSGLEHSTYSNMKEAREAAVEEFLIPVWRGIAAAVTKGLLSEFPNVERHRMSFNTSVVAELQEDEDKKADRAAALFASGIVNRAEARAVMGLKPLAGDENTWSWMLRPQSAPPGMPSGPEPARRARSDKEKSEHGV